MRLLIAAAGLAVLGGCASKPADSARLTLNNPYWDRTNVQLVITRSSDCENRGDGYLGTKELVMARNRLEVIDVPNGANVCWRRDRDPNNPVAGAWTGWTKATLFPGRSAEADL